MEKQIIKCSAAPSAIGPYSQAVLINDMLFISGQIPIDPAKAKIAGADIKIQTHQVLKNLSAILQSADFKLTDIVKTTVYLTDLADFSEFNQVYAKYFPKAPPSRATVQVAALPLNVKIEIEAVAIKTK